MSKTETKRVIRATLPEGGIVNITGKCELLQGNRAPYFSFTTDSGCDHESILKARPDLKEHVAMHLSYDDGQPSHAVANAAYYLTEQDDEALARHLRIPVSEARSIIDEFSKEQENTSLKLDLAPEVYTLKLIRSCFTSCWKRQAEATLAWIKAADPEVDMPEHDEDDFEEEALLMKLPDGDTVEVVKVFGGSYLPMAELGGISYYLAKDSDQAAEATKDYWRDMANNDSAEFTCIVGEETLMRWALGKSAGPGSVSVDSLEEWFELTGNYPEEQWAGYDGEEVNLQVNSELYEELFGEEPDSEWSEVLGYRNN